ncbi:MAG: nucleotidyltransferase [Candidatus Marinimicrobia bacterium]|nr:nucleotidyltransferase [Candidatus Neomarinimicrobiota bacterium]|tara:strand:- start:7394 stop:8245 length:852 start_codon:yes stop_codon:yes gene_type:complete
MTNNLMILAAGISSRMKRSAEFDSVSSVSKEALNKPKMMLNMGSSKRPFLDYLLDNAKNAGYKDILFIINDRDNTVFDYYTNNKGDNFFHGLNFSFAKQVIPNGRSKPLGTADAVITGLKSKPEWSGQKFTVCNSDNLYSVNVLKSLRKDKNLSSLIDYDRDSLGVEPKRVHAFAVIWKDNDGFLTDIVEKPDERQIKEATDKNGRIGVSMNIFKLDYDIIFPLLIETPINPKRDEKELTKTVRMLVDKYEKSVYTIPISERVPDLTTIKDVEDVETFIASKV